MALLRKGCQLTIRQKVWSARKSCEFNGIIPWSDKYQHRTGLICSLTNCKLVRLIQVILVAIVWLIQHRKVQLGISVERPEKLFLWWRLYQVIPVVTVEELMVERSLTLPFVF